MGKTAWKMTIGTWITVRHGGSITGKFGRIIGIEESGLFFIETDGSREIAAVREDFRIVRSRTAPHGYFPMRKTLPYGRYMCADGSYVLHNRDYQPLKLVRPDGKIEHCRPTDRIMYDNQEWFYGDEALREPPWRDGKSFDDCVMILESPFETLRRLAASKW